MSPARAPASLFGLPPSRVRDWLGRYVFALLAVVVAAAIGYSLQVFFGFTPVYTTLYPAVMVVAVLAGFGPGLAATLLSCVVAGYFFVAPRGSFAIAAIGDRVALAVFVVTGAVISVLAETVRRHNVDLTRSKADLSLASTQPLFQFRKPLSS